MDAFQNRYFLFYGKLASFLGVSPGQTYRERILRYFVLTFALLSILALQLCQVFTVDFNLQSFLYLFQLIIPDMCFLAQYVGTIIHFSKVVEVFDVIKRDWQHLKNDDELKIMEKHASQTTICTIVCGFLLLLFIGLLILPPFLRRILSSSEDIDNIDRFPVFFCLDHYLNFKMLYYPALIYQIILFIVMLCVAFGCYSLYFMSIQHICSRLSIVKVELHRPFINDHHNEQSIDLTPWMIDIIQHLGRIKEFVKLINTVGEQNYLIQMTLIFFLLVIDFLCLMQIPALLEHEGSKKDMLIFMVFIVGSLLPIYGGSLIGQRLIDYSEEVYREACLVPFHEISLQTQKLLLMTLMMYAKPYALSIGKVFVSSHEFFSDIFRASFSFAMMLYSTQKV